MVWTNEEVQKKCQDGEPLFDPKDFVWFGHVDLDKHALPELQKEKWEPGQVMMKTAEGLHQGHINPGRKVWTQIYNDEENSAYNKMWHDVFDTVVAEWMSKEPMPNLWGGSENWEISSRGQIIRYEQGHYFGLHQDGGAAFAPRFRVALGLIFLSDSDEYEGGYFRIPAHGITKKFTRGDWLIFPSAMYHELTPILKGVRVAMFSEVFVTAGHWTQAHSDLWNDQTGLNVPERDSSLGRAEEITEHYKGLKTVIQKGDDGHKWMNDGWFPTPYNPEEDKNVVD